MPYVDNPDDKSWRGSMLAYRSRMQSALDGLDATPMQADWRDNNRTILQNNIAFMDECVCQGRRSLRHARSLRQEAGAAIWRRTSPGRRRPRSGTG